jgi:NAD(P)-dependent dehydrogenase (short-subunit alcohol dehydrogenase family)
VARAIVGTFLGRRAAVPSMRRRGGGSIVNINSAAGIGAEAGLAAYGTSKWGIRELTRISAKELAGRTSVSTCTPGLRPRLLDRRGVRRRRRLPTRACPRREAATFRTGSLTAPSSRHPACHSVSP